ncbi:hypothetical protein GCM10022281_11800 [Sphingomonas rosea]|uniref:L,D-TPase catalytic domain-containing protein n=1 Tax=Sphingomonas rosea TaxID=335605 RepID=A0ABP7TZN1_9SPHN
MKRLALLAAAFAAFAATPSLAADLVADESPDAVMAASTAVMSARDDAADLLSRDLKPGGYWWNANRPDGGPVEVRVSLEDQRAYVYQAGELIGVSTISSGKPGKDTPPGIFPILEKKTMHRSRKYDNAPMPFMQRIDNYGIALHAGHIPGRPASHGCVRLPSAFAAKLFSMTKVGDRVVIG